MSPQLRTLILGKLLLTVKVSIIFQIKNCYVFYIEAEVFKDFTNLDFLAFEGGAIDLLDPDAMTGVSVEQLESDSHMFPQPLGHFETRNCAFNTKYVSPGLLFNWKNLTSVSFRVCVKYFMINFFIFMLCYLNKASILTLQFYINYMW